MSPGVNDGPRNTGTLPKSNRRSDRNRERSAANQQIANRSTYHGHRQQHSNNLFQLDWPPVCERESLRTAKNSNTKSAPSGTSASFSDISDFVSHASGRQFNYSIEETIPWQTMVPPTDSQIQSPPRIQGTKPTNVDKMPDRSQVESRLNQIRDYIRVTSTMVDSLSQSSDPRAQAQNEKLSRMVEDLRDSETKLVKLLEQYHNRGIPNQDGESGKEDGDDGNYSDREMQLRKKMEEAQRKLVQLQEHQANLVGMQLRARERLNEARQAQQILIQQENQNTSTSQWESSNRILAPVSTNVEQLESETAELRGKLAQLQTKKKHMDHLVAELQAAEISDRGSCSSEGSRNVSQDKTAELETMKEQLSHLKALMDEATKCKECIDSISESEPEVETSGEAADGSEQREEIVNNSFDQQSSSDKSNHGKSRNSGSLPTLEDVQAVTRELKEHAAILQATRAELRRLKQPIISAATHSNTTSVLPGSTPPPSLVGLNIEKKQSNNITGEIQPIQMKRRQLEDYMRKEQSQSSSVNRDIGGSDINSHRGSTSQISHTGTPANIWPPPTVVGGSNEQSVDGISSSDNLLDIGPQTAAIENGFSGNWWGYPPPPMNQLQYGSAEYYRNLLLSSQAQQLQMMGTTIQQCCQLLWTQQRELQSMHTAINQLQLHLRQTHTPQRINNTENQEEYSNLSRSAHHLGDTLDPALPPSSSLPNLVSLPNSSPALSHSGISASTNSQQHQQQQQQQLNNQVPPGNRANNYWDNFRSYSRQNLLSGNVKTMTDTIPGPISNSASSANTTSSGVNSTLVKDKRNREQGTDNMPLPSLTVAETQYSFNLQLQSNLQQQERENASVRSNIISNEVSQQVENLWEEAHGSFRLSHATNDDISIHNLSSEIREVINSLIITNRRRPDYLIIILKEIKAISEDQKLRPLLLRSLRALQDTQSSNNPLNEATDQTASESCQSSDEDSDVGAMLGFSLENESSLTGLIASTHAGTSSSPTAQIPLIDYLEIPASPENASALPSISSPLKPGCNEDLAEADQSRPESSGNQHILNNDENNDRIQEDVALQLGGARRTSDIEIDVETLAAKAEDERSEDTILDRIPTRLYHH